MTGWPRARGIHVARFRARKFTDFETLAQNDLLSRLLVADLVMADKITRIAIVDANRCKPKRCAQECKKVREIQWVIHQDQG